MHGVLGETRIWRVINISIRSDDTYLSVGRMNLGVLIGSIYIRILPECKAMKS